ncbi:MAG: dimethylmenaquinone methyltransferase [Hyphomicrobiales bacterium]
MAVTTHTLAPVFAEAALLERWSHVPAAIVADVSKAATLIDPAIRPLRPVGQQPRLMGRAVTAICRPPDFGAVLHALDLVQPGEVLVIDAQGFASHAMIGEILGGFLRRRGAAGLVCDGAVRDVAALASWDDFSVFSRSISPAGPTGWSEGVVNGVAIIGGKHVAPGDVILGDDDGLVALSPDLLRLLIEPAEAKLRLEEQWQADIASGKSIAQTFGL